MKMNLCISKWMLMEHLVFCSINTDLFFSVYINQLFEKMYNVIFSVLNENFLLKKKYIAKNTNTMKTHDK